MMAFVWILWKERNDRLLNASFSSNSNLFFVNLCFVAF